MKIKKIALIHHSHADFGYTDHPAVCARIQRDYIAGALDAIDTYRDSDPMRCFRWTAEVSEPVRAFLADASSADRERLFQAVADGLLEVSAFPVNQTPFFSDLEWEEALNWFSEDEYRKLRITGGMQTDVNGMPQAGVISAVKRGMRYFWMGPNVYMGGVPFPPYKLFYWKMPDGSRVLTYMNSGYDNGFYALNQYWRRGPIPEFADLTYRQPTGEDVLSISPENLKAAHERCLEIIGNIVEPKQDNNSDSGANKYAKADGWQYSILPLSFTGNWRVDNDPPFPHLAEFVRAWNDAGYEPALELSTPSRVLAELEAEYANEIPELSGEWNDFWAVGSVSTPPEIAVSRQAKSILRQLKSPLLAKQKINEDELRRCRRDLLWFDEHIWGHWGSIGFPETKQARAQWHTIADYAYRAEAMADMLRGEALRSQIKFSGDGVYVVNLNNAPLDDLVEIETEAVRKELPKALQNRQTGEIIPVELHRGHINWASPKEEYCSRENLSRHFSDMAPDRIMRFRPGIIPAHGTAEFDFFYGDLPEPAGMNCSIELDELGFPKKVNGKKELFNGEFGSFSAFTVTEFSPRWQFAKVFAAPTEAERRQKAGEVVKKLLPVYENASLYQGNGYQEYTQNFSHPLLNCGWRKLLINADGSRAKVTIHLNRKNSMLPECYLITFDTGSTDSTPPLISNGGVPFIPGEEQLIGSCKEFYTIDGTVCYSDRVFACKDSAMITFGEPERGIKPEKLPEKTSRLNALVFDNFWSTNFHIGSTGIMEFSFYLALTDENDDKWSVGEALMGGLVRGMHN